MEDSSSSTIKILHCMVNVRLVIATPH